MGESVASDKAQPRPVWLGDPSRCPSEVPCVQPRICRGESQRDVPRQLLPPLANLTHQSPSAAVAAPSPSPRASRSPVKGPKKHGRCKPTHTFLSNG